MIPTYGLTGGIACGKSSVSRLFTELGIPVIDADTVARQLLTNNTSVKTRIHTYFGPQVLLADGQIDRAWLRQRIFTVADDKRWLEQLLHPLIRANIYDQGSHTQGPYMIWVIPLLIEHLDQYPDLTGIIVVDTDDTSQKLRLKARDGHSDVFIDKMIAAQINRQQRLAHADFVLHNNQDLSHLQRQVQTLDQQLRQQ